MLRSLFRLIKGSEYQKEHGYKYGYEYGQKSGWFHVSLLAELGSSLHQRTDRKTLGSEPAMAAGVTDRLRDVSDLVDLRESYEPRRTERAA
jgi:hypothetical protein